MYPLNNNVCRTCFSTTKYFLPRTSALLCHWVHSQCAQCRHQITRLHTSNHCVVHTHQSDHQISSSLVWRELCYLSHFYTVFIPLPKNCWQKLMVFFHMLFGFFAKLHHFDKIILNRCVGIYGNTILKLTYLSRHLTFTNICNQIVSP